MKDYKCLTCGREFNTPLTLGENQSESEVCPGCKSDNFVSVGGITETYYPDSPKFTSSADPFKYEIPIYHILPLNDTYEHTENMLCKCNPKRIEHEGIVIVHNSFDGREGVELAKEILNKRGPGNSDANKTT